MSRISSPACLFLLLVEFTLGGRLDAEGEQGGEWDVRRKTETTGQRVQMKGNEKQAGGEI